MTIKNLLEKIFTRNCQCSVENDKYKVKVLIFIHHLLGLIFKLNIKWN